MKLCVLASGSSGNATYIEYENTSILIDVGISKKMLCQRLSLIGKNITDIDAIFVSHEHTDHIKGISKLTKIPVYANKKTGSMLPMKTRDIDHEISFKNMKIKPIPISHDAVHPQGYKISCNGASAAVITDVGTINNHIREEITDVQALVIEANHDIDLLLNGPYPYHLKQRILGDKGHISNIDACLLIEQHAKKIKHVIFAHLSKTNNDPDLLLKTWSNLITKKISCSVASQKEITKVISI